MASRQEEKERRRRERMEREAAEKRAAARGSRLRMVGAGVLGLAVIAGIVLALVVGLGGREGDARETQARDELPTLPTPQVTNLADAAEAANCELVNPRYEGNEHASREFRAGDYQTNPPTSGDHDPQWYDDGIYAPGATPRLGMLVHTLEHGRINVQYRPGTPEATVRQLEALLAESNDGYHMLLYENTTEMPSAVSATTWNHALNCEQMNPQVFDAIRAFRTRWIDRGPERDR